jgi:ribosomal protein S18 acetylase RimI-like enzyme
MSAYSIRAATPEDMPLIFDSWAKSFRLAKPRKLKGCGPVADDTYVELGSDDKRRLAPNVWAEALTWTVERLAERSAIAVAFHPSHAEVVVGWVAFENVGDATTIHYAWVRPGHRREGVARMLLAKVGELHEGSTLRASFMTRDGKDMLQRLALLEDVAP